MWRGISLANKCLLLFGAAVVLIIVAALAVPWLRMQGITIEANRQLARHVVLAWEKLAQERAADASPVIPGQPEEVAGFTVTLLRPEQVKAAAEEDRFVRRAWEQFEARPGEVERYSGSWSARAREDRYAKAVRDPDGTLRGMILLHRRAPAATLELLADTVFYFLSAGLIALGLAVLVFYLITTKLILSPVRELRETAELVRQGDLAVRSRISTGDEFEELSDTFNQMLEALTATQDQLRAINKSLDVKLNELSERNIALHEANRLKGEFVANVSHELRTPLNSIIGFAELLLEIAEREAAAGDDSTRLAKRRRYLEHIITAGRSLLEMINGLLEMAKVEAGRVDLHPEPVSVSDLCEGLVAMMRPQADKVGVELTLEVAADVPMIETDGKKLQQIVYNLLSNAVKFTGDAAQEAAGLGGSRPAKVTLRVERLIGRAGEGPEAEDRVRISVLDTGPGIAKEDLSVIFEKFRQLDSGHTRRHTGTGLGLAISKELTQILQGEIHVESEVGRGSMFSVILPLRLSRVRAEETRLELALRGALAGRAGGAAAVAGHEGAGPGDNGAAEPLAADAGKHGSVDTENRPAAEPAAEARGATGSPAAPTA